MKMAARRPLGNGILHMRIALIHALRHSPPPIEAAFRELWPDAQLMNLLDDSLSADLARTGRLTPAMTERFLTLARYAKSTGADAIQFTCSAFGPCIEAVAKEFAPMPVLKPNEAMIEEAVTQGRRIGLLATFPGTLASMPSEFPSDVTIVPQLAEGALAALDRGDTEQHDGRAARASLELKDCDVIVLAQFSLARAAGRVALATGKPVLTTPHSAVRKLKRMLLAQPGGVEILDPV
jgi:Asp/Glu/hydantoin racemase